MRFEGQVALVTGAAGGIGQSIVAARRVGRATIAGTDSDLDHMELDDAFSGDLLDTAFAHMPLNEDFIDTLPDPAAFRARIGENDLLRRIGAPEEVASLNLWLGSDEARFVTSQVWTIYGGRMTQLSVP